MNPNDHQYTRDICTLVVVTPFDTHPLASRTVFINDHSKPHRFRVARTFPRNNAITTLPWPAMSPDVNSMEHIWDLIGRRVQARDSHVQNLT